MNLNVNNRHSDPTDSCSTFWEPDITDLWSQQEETHSKFSDLSNVACNILSIISHNVRVEARLSFVQHDISYRESETTAETWCKIEVER